MNDYCVICGKEIMTESGHVCRLCANSSQRGGTTTNLLGLLAGGAIVAAVIIASNGGTPETPHLLSITDDGQSATVALQADGVFTISGSVDGVQWTVIEANWDTTVYGRTLLVNHQRTGWAMFKAEPL